MGEMSEKNNLTRRDFLKIGGLVGIATQAIAIPGLAYKAAASNDTFTGWESFEGDTQFFNRQPFELKGGLDELYERVFPKEAVVSRPNMMTDFPPIRGDRIRAALAEHPDWTPEDGREALELGPDLDAYYEFYEGRGQDRFSDDFRVQTVQIPEWIANHEIYDDHFALSMAYFGAWADHLGTVPEVTEPPEVSDYQYVDHGHTVDIRDVNAAREDRNALLQFKSPQHAAELIKKVAHLYGATLVGITTMNPDYVYAQIRGVEPTPEPAKVPEHWKYVIVFGVPHEWDQLTSNPQYGDSYDAYNRSRMVGYRLEAFIKRLGYAARRHVPDGSYDLIVPPFAIQAGLGEWGRCACVITPELGANFRYGVITTELEMEIDQPIDFGVTDFCKDCKICAEICPSSSISFADSPEGMVARGIEHWDINNSTCFGFWMESMGPLGCRLCIAACPYSRKDNWVHGVARVVDPIDPTGLFNDTLIWMQKTLFDAPEASAYKKPPDGCFASYRPAPEWLQTEAWFDVNPADPHDLCN